MSTPEPIPNASGRTVVAVFIVSAFVFGGFATWMRYSNRDAILDAQLKTVPTLAAMVAVGCAAGGPATELHRGGKCPVNGALALSMSAPGAGTRSVVYALLEAGAAAQSGNLDEKHPASLPLGKNAGARTLLLLLASSDVPAAALQEALDRTASSDVSARVAAADAFAATLIREEHHARVERFDFEASEAR